MPQRFITVNDLSPLDAAVRLLTFGAFIPFGGVVAGALMGKKVPPMWLVLAGVILEIIGVVLLSRIGVDQAIDKGQYGFQFLAGFGTGMINAGLIILVPYIMEKRDLGKHMPRSGSNKMLTLSSRRVSRQLTVPNSGRSCRNRYRGLSLDALHPRHSSEHCAARDCVSLAGEDGDCQDIGAGGGSKCSQSFWKELQPASENSDWFCGCEAACHGADVDQCEVGHLKSIAAVHHVNRYLRGGGDNVPRRPHCQATRFLGCSHSTAIFAGSSSKNQP